jgi:hypothetical protein
MVSIVAIFVLLQTVSLNIRLDNYPNNTTTSCRLFSFLSDWICAVKTINSNKNTILNQNIRLNLFADKMLGVSARQFELKGSVVPSLLVMLECGIHTNLGQMNRCCDIQSRFCRRAVLAI